MTDVLPAPVAKFLAQIADRKDLPVGVRAEAQRLLGDHGIVGRLRNAHAIESIASHYDSLRHVAGHGRWSAAREIAQAPAWHARSPVRVLSAVLAYQLSLKLVRRPEVRRGH